jgi:pectate lyase C
MEKLNRIHSRVRYAVLATALVGLFSAAQAATVTFTSTYNVPAGVTYDGKGNTIKAVGMGDGSQNESQQPFFKLNAGSTVKNVILSAPGVDGIHYYGNGTIDNVTWQDVGEDASTIKSAGTCVMKNSRASSAADKFGQCNAASTWTMQNVTETTSGKIIRQNGGTTYNCKFYYNTVNSDQCKEAIGRTDSSGTRFYYRSLTVTNFTGSKGWWYGRPSQASAY